MKFKTSDKVLLVIVIYILWLFTWISMTDAKEIKYNSSICTTNKCKARVERLNNCYGDVKCATDITLEKSYENVYSELEKLKELSSKVVVKNSFDINKLAYSVAMQETKDCTLWYWKTHNNCFWIKHWNTVPCPWVPKLAMCRFKTKEESYRAFKIIWQKWYWWLPNYEKAKRWSWDDRANIWRKNVLYYYNKD